MTADLVRVLVVDDEPDLAEVIAELLRSEGFEVDTAMDAAQAIEQIICRRPTCVLLDINMPRVDGLELARSIRSRCGDDVVLIAVTDSDTSNPRVEEALALVDHHFLKPLDFVRLLKILKS